MVDVVGQSTVAADYCVKIAIILCNQAYASAQAPPVTITR
jgi:hypothetical protein